MDLYYDPRSTGDLQIAFCYISMRRITPLFTANCADINLLARRLSVIFAAQIAENERIHISTFRLAKLEMGRFKAGSPTGGRQKPPRQANRQDGSSWFLSQRRGHAPDTYSGDIEIQRDRR